MLRADLDNFPNWAKVLHLPGNGLVCLKFLFFTPEFWRGAHRSLHARQEYFPAFAHDSVQRPGTWAAAQNHRPLLLVD
jgi:hypothetical protein